MFTPTYSYELLPTANVAGTLIASAGNVLGSGTPAPTTATITSPTSNVVLGTSFTLTAVTYQWRLNNFDVPASTSSTCTIASVQNSNASGSTLVSAPLTVAVSSSSSSSSLSSSGSSSSSGGNGGGANAPWVLLTTAALFALRVTLQGRKNPSASRL